MKNVILYYFIFLIMVPTYARSQRESLFSQELNSGWEVSEVGKDQWFPASVPGCVHTDLLRNNIIKDPFFRLNELDVQWVDKKDWVYKSTFHVSGKMFKKERLQLDFKGLDTHADVFLNGEKILVANNMFRGWQVEVKGILQKGANELKIYFHSPIKVGLEKYDNYPHVVQSSSNDLAKIGQVPGNKWVSPHLRKPGYHFGWDWGPRLVTSGIWKPIYLKGWDNAHIQDLRIVQNSLEEKKAVLTAEFEVEAEDQQKGKFQIEVNGHRVGETVVELNKGKGIYSLEFEIADPQKWWTNGLGEAYLYSISGFLKTKGGKEEVSHNIGLRTVELVREKDSIGTSFYFKVNGHPVFMKGANYIPNDVFLDRVSPKKYEEVILWAKNSNMNMLRVWGGGIYEKDIFYDLCDKHGILVWQDFMFACNMYPGHPEYLENVKQEAEYNIKRLRNHPSLAMWCGNNEVLAAWLEWGWNKKTYKEDPKGSAAQWKAYQDIFLDILPKAVAEFDPQRFYWSSSPQAGPQEKVDFDHGDAHYWSVWAGVGAPFSSYRENIARFMSEYGFQAFPDFSSVKKYTSPEDWDIYSEVMKSHQRSSVGNQQIEKYMRRDYRMPKDFESFLYVGQVLQAEGIRLAMESHRAAMPRNMGSLYWQLNDCWPVASWSGTDYYGKWKAMQYFCKKAYEEVLVVPRVEGENLKVYVVSDRLSSFEGEMELALMDFSGKSLWSSREKVVVKENTSKQYFSKPLLEVLSKAHKKDVVLVATLWQGEKEISENTLYFCPVKELDLPKAEVRYEVEKKDDKVQITFSSEKLAKNVYISVEGYDGNYSDNFFDLLPGEEKVVTFSSDMSQEEIKKGLAIRTIRDTY